MDDEAQRGLDGLVASSRFAHAWALLDQPEEIHRIGGLDALRRMLTARGLSMSDLLPRLARAGGTTSPAPAPPPPRAEQPFPRPGARPLDREADAAALMRAVFMPSDGLRTVTGASIPRTVTGRVVELAARPSGVGEVAAFAVKGGGCVYGPIAAIDAATIERLRTGADADARMTAHLSPPTPGLPHPDAFRVAVALA